MYLNENDYQNELTQIEKGDKFVLQKPNGALEYSTVEMVTGTQIVLVNNSKKYFIMIPSAIDGNTLSYLDSNKKWHNIKFEDIKIKNDSGKNIIIQPNAPEPEEKVDPEFKKEIETNLVEFKSAISKLKEGSKLFVGYGEWEFDENGKFLGNPVEGSDTEILFVVTQIKNKIIRMKLTGLDGNDTTMEPFRNKEFSINVDNNLFQYDEEGVFMSINTPNGQATLKYLYMVNIFEPTDEENIVSQETKESRIKFHKIVTSLKRGDTLTVKFGEMSIGKNGIAKYEVTEKTETFATFEMKGLLNGYIYTKMTGIKGHLADDFQKYDGSYMYFPLTEKLFTYDTKGVILNVQHLNDIIKFKYVYFVDSDGGENEEVEGEEDNPESRMTKLSHDEDLMRLIQTRTWRDRLMGREGVGINPLRDIEKRLGINRSSKKYVEFKMLDRDVKVGEGGNLWLRKDRVVHGKMVNSDRLIVKSKNGKEELHLFLNNTSNRDIYNVKITHQDSDGGKNAFGNGKIEILE